jgi:ubiquinone/menaquinone biosynthesis C-methylase UbiE
VVAEHLERLPFDLYARYRVAAALVELVHPEPGGLLLDVGGGPGGTLAGFCPDHLVVASDRYLPTHWHTRAPDLVLADGAELPFADDAFDVVVSLDTLEHVPAERRGALLRELVRVSRGWVLVGCPCATPGVADADAALLSYVRHRFGEEFDTVAVLTEHLANGHPDPERIAATLSATGAEVARFPSGRLDRWLPMMLLFYDLMALGRDDPVERVQAWYNRLLSDDDLRDPAYRQVFVARLPGAPGPPLDEVIAAIVPDTPPRAPGAAAFEALRQVLGSALPEAVAAERARAEAAEAELAGVRADLERTTARAEAAEIHVRSLLEFRDRVLNHPAMKLRRGVRRTFGVGRGGGEEAGGTPNSD